MKAIFKESLWNALALLSILGVTAGAATLRLPRARIDGQPVIDLPAPSGLQSVAIKSAITISWDWQAPEVMPNLVSFGFEIKRQDGKLFLTSDHSFTDSDLNVGSFTYVIRARGESKSKAHGQWYLSHISDWSSEIGATLTRHCTASPQVRLAVETADKKYRSVSSLRMHFIGDVELPEGCHLQKLTYRLDSGTGIMHSGPLQADRGGHFDTFINALDAEDEIPAGSASFAAGVVAEDEAGPASSAVYTLEVELENRFAPKN